ncbi:hypothetical protein [Bacillus gobiensis]|uniref:hypothetical protein n=1 Tax=Bacillus gobiensis TaxID=1441095 RepID=UPI003D247A51
MNQLTGYLAKPFSTVNAEKLPLSNSEKKLLLGKVVKFAGEEHAVLQVGSSFIKAKLDIPLTLGNTYLFHFQKNTSEPAGTMQVIQAFKKEPKTIKHAAATILSGLSMSQTKENLALISQLLGTNQPFTKEELQAAVNWLSGHLSHEAEEAIDTLQFTLKKGFPIETKVLNSLHSLKDESTLSDELAELHHALENLPHQQNHLLQRMRDQLLAISHSDQFVHAEKMVKYFSAIEAIMQKQVGAYARLQSVIASPTDQIGSFSPHLERLTDFQLFHKVEYRLFKKIAELAGTNGISMEKQIFQLLRSASDQASFWTDQKIFHPSEAKRFSQIAEKTAPTIGKNDLHSFLRKINELIGHRHELSIIRSLGKKSFPLDTITDSLKLLLNEAALSQELPENVQQKAEQMINRFNGQLLVLQDDQTATQLLIYLPLSLNGLSYDMKVIYNGKKNKNNELDLDQCRLVFFLQLPYLKETIVDCFIQKKVISLKVEAEFELTGLIQQMTPDLKDRLFTLGYHLTVITAKQRKKSRGSFFANELKDYISETGWDIKI